MKKILPLITLLFSIALMAEDIPQNYYADIDGKQDDVLKTALSLIVRGGERYEYGPNQYHSSSNPPEWEKGDLKAYGTWQAFPETDLKPEAQGVVWDMYSNSVRYYPNKTGESGCSLNIEHCLPKSWWGGTVNEAYKDLFNLNPSDAQANSNKSNYAPGHVQKGDKFNNGSFRMDSKSKSQYGYICWEPAEEYRGDFARTYFYMATAYEYLEWTAYADYISNANYLMFSDAIIQVLLDWHRADPVSDKEVCRADRISTIQGNRNPYIDYPELVEYIWGDKKGQAVDLASLECAFVSGICPDPVVPEPEEQLYDTLINLPALTKAIINAYQSGDIQGYASEKIQSNGTVSITMGASSTDGEISFTGIALTKDAELIFRASPYNTANSMQIDVYANDAVIETISETVEQNTRNEIRYKVAIPQTTTSIKLVSVGGATTKRACMQELYLRCAKDGETGLEHTSVSVPARKVLRNGQLYIIRDGKTYNVIGQTIR